MGTDLLIFAVLMASAAVGLFVYCAIVEVIEGWDIRHDGWAHGHHHSHLSAGGGRVTSAPAREHRFGRRHSVR